MPEASMPPVPRKRAGTGLVPIAIMVLLAVGYGLHERKVARQNFEQNAQLSAALHQTQSELAALTSKINTISASQPATVVVHAPDTRRPAARRVDDPRWKKFRSELDDQGRQIKSTRNELASARTELAGSIARTHDEVAMLQKRGERNYYEFDLQKSKQFARSGPVGIALRKANTKQQYADLQMMVDDVKLTRKHVNLYEPVMFYTADGAQPAELVINSITKDHIRGYISEPKYRRSELAVSNTAPQNSTSANAESRKRLQLP